MPTPGLLRLALLAGAFVMGLRSSSQITFNVHLDSVQAGRRGNGLSIRETPEGYLLLTRQFTSPGSAPMHLYTRQLDAEGRVTAEYEHGTGDPRIHWSGGIDPMTESTDGTFITVVAKGSAPTDSTWLYRFSPAGELLSESPLLGFPAEDSVWHSFMHVRPLSDGGLLLCGEKKVGSAPTRGFLVRMDADGGLVWAHTYLHAATLTDARELPDGGFALAGYRNATIDRSIVLRSDADGNLIWVRYTGERAPGLTSIRLSSDGAVVSWSNHTDIDWPSYLGQTVLTKRSVDGTLIWENRSASGYYRYASDLEALPNGGFVACGSHGSRGMLMRFDSEGDSLWSRRYTLLNEEHYYHDVQIASDGGFILAGTTWRHPLIDTLVQTQEIAWVMRTDSLGCVVPGCHTVGVQEIVVDLNEHLRIAPNPASFWLQAELPLSAGTVLHGKVRAVLLNAQGQKMLIWPMQRTGDLLSLRADVSALPSGVYHLHIADAERWLAGGKVMVE